MSGLSDLSKRLLRTVFGTDAGDANVECIKDWKYKNPRASRARDAQPKSDEMVYYSVGMMTGDRANANVRYVGALDIDDVGVEVDGGLIELIMPAPSYIVESSPGSFHYGWAIKGGCTVEEHKALRAGVKARFGVTHASAVSNLVRLPEGVNVKHPGFRVHGEVSGLAYEYAVLQEACGAGAPKAAGSAAGGPQKGTLAEVEALLRRLPNTEYDYDFWIAVGLAIKGALGEDGRDAWITWSNQLPAIGYTPEEKWDTFFPTSAGLGALEIIVKARVGSAGMAADVFDDGITGPEPIKVDIDAYVPVADRKLLARRGWVYGSRLIRGFMSATVAAGGVGKSALTLVEAISMATGVDLLATGKMARAPLRVLVWNGEDPYDEMVRRVEAILLHYGLTGVDLGGRLFIKSGNDMPVMLASSPGRGGIVENEEMILGLVKFMREKKIDVMVIDPLVSTHKVSENDNMAMEVVAKALRRMASACDCAVEVVHHSRKAAPGMNGGSASTDDARGASAIMAAARHMRVLTPMTKEVGAKYGIRHYRLHFCVQPEGVKTNMTPPLDGDRWYRLVSVDLGNGDLFPGDGGLPIEGDNVGVVEKWTLGVAHVDDPAMAVKAYGLMAGKQWRFDAQAGGKEWVGYPVGEALGIDVLNGGSLARTQAKEAVRKWLDRNWLIKSTGKSASRHEVVTVEAGCATSVF